jgi:hypothetical protein
MKDTVPYRKHWNAVTSDMMLMFRKLCLNVPEKFVHQGASEDHELWGCCKMPTVVEALESDCVQCGCHCFMVRERPFLVPEWSSLVSGKE